MQIRCWALADTHLSFGKPKDMSKFGAKWENHTEQIATAWHQLVAPGDIVLIPGDISWASTMRRFEADLAWLSNLPGRKVLLRGNHDHWWIDISRVRKIIETWGFYALEGDSITLDGVIICGAMGHVAPQDPYYVEDATRNRYARELRRLEAALTQATAQRAADQPVILMMHYPPFTSDGKPTAYVDLITSFQPTLCVYGHLHHEAEWEVACNTLYNGVQYQLVAADFLEMKPCLILSLEKTDQKPELEVHSGEANVPIADKE